MFAPVISGLIVSLDAFFIGISLGLQKKCKFSYLVIINAFLMGLCILGYLIAGRIYELIEFDTDIIVGISFIVLGLWCIGQYFVSEHIKRRNNCTEEECETSPKTIAIVGVVMSVEAMLITMGITFVFHQSSTFLIPIAVGLAHFAYSALSFRLARMKYVRRIPIVISHIVSGLALIIYGLLAIFVEFGV